MTTDCVPAFITKTPPRSSIEVWAASDNIELKAVGFIDIGPLIVHQSHLSYHLSYLYRYLYRYFILITPGAGAGWFAAGWPPVWTSPGAVQRSKGWGASIIMIKSSTAYVSNNIAYNIMIKSAASYVNNNIASIIMIKSPAAYV